MQPEFTYARYEIITHHALALSGVLAAEIHLRDSANGPLRLIASSIAPPALAPFGDDRLEPREEQNAPLLDAEGLAPFFSSVLSQPGLHSTDLVPTPTGRFTQLGSEAANGQVVAHLVAGRIEAHGTAMG